MWLISDYNCWTRLCLAVLWWRQHNIASTSALFGPFWQLIDILELQKTSTVDKTEFSDLPCPLTGLHKSFILITNVLSGLLNRGMQAAQDIYGSLVARPSPTPVFDRLQYAKMEGEGLMNLTTWFAAQASHVTLIGASRSETQPSGTALQDACVCLLVCLVVNFKFAFKYFQKIWTFSCKFMDCSLPNSTLMDGHRTPSGRGLIDSARAITNAEQRNKVTKSDVSATTNAEQQTSLRQSRLEKFTSAQPQRKSSWTGGRKAS